ESDRRPRAPGRRSLPARWSCPPRWVRSARAPRLDSPQTKCRRAHAARRTAWSLPTLPSVPARTPPCGCSGWQSIRSFPHLVSPDKKDEPDDVLVLVRLVRAQRDRKRAACMVQDDIARGRAIPGLAPGFAEAGLEVSHGSCLFRPGLPRGGERLGIAGVGCRSIERAIPPT